MGEKILTARLDLIMENTRERELPLGSPDARPKIVNVRKHWPATHPSGIRRVFVLARGNLEDFRPIDGNVVGTSTRGTCHEVRGNDVRGNRHFAALVLEPVREARDNAEPPCDYSGVGFAESEVDCSDVGHAREYFLRRNYESL